MEVPIATQQKPQMCLKLLIKSNKQNSQRQFTMTQCKQANLHI